jgi:hypothetical protein
MPPPPAPAARASAPEAAAAPLLRPPPTPSSKDHSHQSQLSRTGTLLRPGPRASSCRVAQPQGRHLRRIPMPYDPISRIATASAQDHHHACCQRHSCVHRACECTWIALGTDRTGTSDALHRPRGQRGSIPEMEYRYAPRTRHHGAGRTSRLPPTTGAAQTTRRSSLILGCNLAAWSTGRQISYRHHPPELPNATRRTAAARRVTHPARFVVRP